MRAAQPSPPKAAPLSEHRREAELEAWMCDRLRLPHLFAGVTDKGTRVARLKVVLMERGLTESIAPGKLAGKAVTWRQLFKTYAGEEIA